MAAGVAGSKVRLRRRLGCCSLSMVWRDGTLNDPGQKELSQKPDGLLSRHLLGLKVGVLLEVFVEPLGGLQPREAVFISPKLPAVFAPRKSSLQVSDDATSMRREKTKHL